MTCTCKFPKFQYWRTRSASHHDCHITPLISLQVPAKRNPQLRVGFLREDGYHDTTMVWQVISLYDNLLISHNPHGPSMTVTGIDNERIPTDSRKLGHQNGGGD
jgi:4-diphosphocytidyl-2C-methyl-D-erythritol kinase